MNGKAMTWVPGLALLGLFAMLLGFVVFGAAEEEKRAGSCRPGILGQFAVDPASGGAAEPSGLPGRVGKWDREQVGNAAKIIAAGVEIDVPARAQAIAVMTAMGESSLRVLDYGDAVGPDSRGLFQQRDNGAWGTYEDRMDPRISSINFYKALLRVDGWQTLPPTIAAHNTQRNADPYYYEQFWAEAIAMLRALTGNDALTSLVAAGAVDRCDQTMLASTGAVTYPVPPSLKDTDSGNWGATGSYWSSWHTGTDFGVACGTPVLASHAGTVQIDTTEGWAGPQLVKVTVGPGQLTTWYAHMQSVDVADGDVVRPGQVLGEAGAEGNVSGCHLHFEVHLKGGSIYGKDNTDPSEWLAANVGQVIELSPASSGQAPRIGTFNVLGTHHTSGKPGWASGGTRMRGALQLLAREEISAVALQELETAQAKVLAGSTKWATYLARGNRTFADGTTSVNAIVWDPQQWVGLAGSDYTVASGADGKGRDLHMPVVRLQHRATGVELFLVGVHHPATGGHGDEAPARRRAMTAAHDVAASLRADTGLPVLVAGDFNDRAPAFCKMTDGGLLTAAAGGSNTDAGGCEPPTGYRPIDWIFGAGVEFSGLEVTSAVAGGRRVSDHPLVSAQVTPSS